MFLTRECVSREDANIAKGDMSRIKVHQGVSRGKGRNVI